MTITTLSAIVRSSVLVDLTISSYAGRKQDRATQDEVTAAAGAGSRRAASVYKSLFADCDELEAITKLQARARAMHYRLTLPWSDNGSRLLPIKTQQRYVQTMQEYQSEFYSKVNQFLDRYDTLVAAAAFKLGTLFDRSEYPTRSKVAGKFRMETTFSPLPTSGDFRLDVENDFQRHLMEQYEARSKSMLEQAQRDAWTRLHKALTHLTDRLTVKEGSKTRIFDTLVSNPLELCGLLTEFNITNDPALEQARKRLESVMLGTSADELRKHPDARDDVRVKVEKILADNDWGMIDDDAEEV